jgi:hypothetical protein
MSCRQLIKASAIAGAAAWTAPILMTSNAGAATTLTCAGVKIPSSSAINGGTVALCNTFPTDNPANLERCVTSECSNYSPKFGFFFKICGPVATNLTQIAVKWAGNASGCTDIGTGDSFNASGCRAVSPPPGPGAYTSAGVAQWSTCSSGDPASGNMVEISAIDGTYSNPDAGINAPAAGPNNRWLFLSAPGGLNEIGLVICFPVGSVPPACGSCAA